MKNFYIIIMSNKPRTQKTFINNNSLLHILQNLNVQNTEGRTPLHEYIINSNLEMIRLILTSNFDCDFNLADEDGCSPFYYAIAAQDYAMIRLINDIRPNVNIVVNNILDTYFRSDDQAILELFTHSQKIKFTIGNCQSFSALHLAIYMDMDNIAKELVKSNDVDINDCNNNLRISPFNLALKEDKPKYIEYIMEHPDANIDLNYVFQDTDAQLIDKECVGSTLLHLLVTMNESESLITKILENQNVNINAKNEEMLTPLQIAFAQDYFVYIKLFLEQREDIDVNIVDNEGNTFLHFVTNYEYEGNEDEESDVEYIASILSTNPAIKINAQNNAGNTPLHNLIANYNNSCEDAESRDEIEQHFTYLIQLLINHPNINVHIKNINGENPLQLAVEKNWLYAVKLILTKTGNIEDLDFSFMQHNVTMSASIKEELETYQIKKLNVKFNIDEFFQDADSYNDLDIYENTIMGDMNSH